MVGWPCKLDILKGGKEMANELEFYQLDDQTTLKHLSTIGKKIEPFLDELLDNFYTYIQKNPDLKNILAGSDINHLKKAQKKPLAFCYGKRPW